MSARVNKVRKFVVFWDPIIGYLLCLIDTNSGCLHGHFFYLGAPIIMSSPHFYQADAKYVQSVFGMKPVKEQHETTIDVHPVGIHSFFLLFSVVKVQHIFWSGCMKRYH